MAVSARLLFKPIERVLNRLLAKSFYRAAKKLKQYGFLLNNPSLKTPHQYSSYPHVSKCSLKNRASQTLVCDFNGALLRRSSTNSTLSFFPFFMLVAFEAGSLLRAIILLLSWPILCLLDWDSQFRAMIFISFCGLPIDAMANVASTVLPKFYLENLNLHVFELFQATGSKFVFTSVPKVMVGGFLRNYLNVNDVIGTELQTCGRYYTGLVSQNGLVVKHKALIEYFGEENMPDIGIGAPNLHDHLFISLCKEAFVVESEENKEEATSSVVPREKYPKPLIFHDGRLAFLPTPFASLCAFMWIPFGILLAIIRVLIGIFLPYKLAILVGSWSGLRISLKGYTKPSTEEGKKAGVLYACTHRTLLDPVFLSASLGKPLVAVAYSLSKFSEILSPIKTVSLTRDKAEDRETMQKVLADGNLLVCPEGTTCREPYLLRFSPLFAELTDEIVPVALNTSVSMFYGTTASGLKWLDSIFFLMNPRPSYDIVVLPKIPKEMTCAAGGKSRYEVANYIQRQLADVLGFECTQLTRKDKYLMLAGNDGTVQD